MQPTEPLWERSASLPRFSKLETDQHVDVAVVGAGITGLTAATLLARTGKRVAVLEMRRIGAGVTGATTAHVTEAVDARYHELERKFGAEGAQLVRESSRAAIEFIAESAGSALCQRVEGFLCATSERTRAELELEFEAARRAGASVTLREGGNVFAGSLASLIFSNQAQLDPLDYLAKLVDGLRAASLPIYEETTVLDVEGDGPLRLSTSAGPTVVADAVLLATHAPYTKLKLQAELTQYRSYAAAGEAKEFPAGLYWDMATPYRYVRTAVIDGTNSVIFGGGDHRTGELPADGAEAPFNELVELAARWGVRLERRWSAQVVESADGLPFIGRPDPKRPVYVATGFGGNGTTFGTLAAMIVTDDVLGRRNRFAELYRANRFKAAALGRVLSENAGTAAHLVAGHVKPVSHEPLASLASGEGRIMRVNGDKLAVYRDPDGVIHSVSAVCTHMGCQVAFNPVERSWDCPCHGSRFDIDGRVLDGPAARPLEKRQTEPQST